LKLQRIASS